MDVDEVLVTLEHAGGVAAIVLSQGRVWLTDRLAAGAASEASGSDGVRIGIDDRTLTGGLLPPGAVAVVVIDAAGRRHDGHIGDGAWIALLDEPLGITTAPVCFLDRDGNPVRRRPIAERQREPVTDADEACPACGNTNWEKLTPAPHAAADMGGRAVPVLACALCGYEEAGTFFAVPPPVAARGDDPPPANHAALERRRRLRETTRATLSAVEFAVYAPHGLPVVVSGWGASGDAARGPDHVTVTHRSERTTFVSVQTARVAGHSHLSDAAAVREALTGVSDRSADPWPQRSAEGLAVWVGAQRRRSARIAATSSLTTRTLRVDRLPQSFRFAGDDGAWAAIGRVGGVQLTVTVRDIAPDAIDLRPIAGPLPVRDLPET